MFDYDAARHYLQKKHHAIQSRRFHLWEQARKDSSDIVEMIIHRYAPHMIIQWGSVLESQHFSEASDIDLAVAGVDSLMFLQLLAEAEEMTTFPLDLVRWENVHPSFRTIICMKGKVMYARR